MNCRYLVLALLSALLLTGCFGPQVQVGNETYDALSPREEAELIELAAYYLKKNSPAVISREEAEQISRLQPVLKIDYYGDRQGRAGVTWRLKKRIVQVSFDGLLLTPEARCWVEIEDIAPEVLDLRRNKSSDAK